MHENQDLSTIMLSKERPKIWGEKISSIFNQHWKRSANAGSNKLITIVDSLYMSHADMHTYSVGNQHSSLKSILMTHPIDFSVL